MGFLSTLAFQANYYLVMPLLIGWAVIYLVTEDLFCMCDEPTVGTLGTCQRITSICSEIRMKKIHPSVNYTKEDIMSPGLFAGMNEMAQQDYLLGPSSAEFLNVKCRKGFDNKVFSDSPKTYFTNSFPLVLCIHALIILCSTKCLLWFRNEPETDELAENLNGVELERLDEKETWTTLKRLVGVYAGNFRRIGTRTFYFELVGSFLACTQFYLIWWYCNGDAGVVNVALDALFGNKDPMENLMTPIYNPFPRVLNCSFYFPRGIHQALSCDDGLHTTCFKLSNLRNEVGYYILTLWFVTLIWMVVIQEFVKWFRLMVSCTKIAVFKRCLMSCQFLPSNMHAYPASASKLQAELNLYSEMEYFYFLRLNDLIHEPEVTQRFVNIYMKIAERRALRGIGRP